MTPPEPARPPRRVRGDLVLHPVALVGLAVLLLNDHVLKAAAPGWVTGKLSDVAGLAFFPFLLLAAREVLTRRVPTVRSAAAGAALTAVVFTAIKVADGVRAAYAAVVGVLRFPVDALLSGARAPVEVVVVPDASDLLALGACAAVVWVVARTRRMHRPGSGTRQTLSRSSSAISAPESRVARVACSSVQNAP